MSIKEKAEQYAREKLGDWGSVVHSAYETNECTNSEISVQDYTAGYDEAITLFVMIQELYRTTNDTIALIIDTAALFAIFPAGSVGAIKKSVGMTALQIAYNALILIAVIDLANNIFADMISPVRKHKGITQDYMLGIHRIMYRMPDELYARHTQDYMLGIHRIMYRMPDIFCGKVIELKEYTICGNFTIKE